MHEYFIISPREICLNEIIILESRALRKTKKSTTVSKKHQEFVHESSILEEYNQHRRFYQVLRLSCRFQASLARPLLQHQIEKHK